MIVKVCGMRDSHNIRQIEAAGPDMMGFIFYPPSSRYVSAKPDYLPQSCFRVGVFVNADIEEICAKVDQYGLHAVQLHGDESPEFAKLLHTHIPDIKIIKMLALTCADDFSSADNYADVADMLLFEPKSTGYGGSGRHFDWQLLEQYHGRLPFMLSGGISPDDADVILQLDIPLLCGVDINSRFETAPAIKDPTAVANFIHRIKSTPNKSLNKSPINSPQ